MSHRIWQFVLCLLLSAAVPVVASEDEFLRGDPVSLHGSSLRAAEANIAGAGIALSNGRTSRAAFDAHGREVVWREIGRSTSADGVTHVAYRQFLIGKEGEAELAGGELGVHYDPSGNVEYISGAQFTSILVTNAPQTDSASAAERARQAGRSFARRLRTTEVTASGTKLQVVRMRNGEFRYVWRTSTSGAGAQDVVIDAQSDEVVAIEDRSRYDECVPDSPTAWVTASSRPSNPAGPERSDLVATEAPSRFAWYVESPYWAPFTHEAYWPASQNVPAVAIYQQISSPLTDPTRFMKCNRTVVDSYALVPLRDDPWHFGNPVYEDDHGWLGRQAGEAIYNTHETMMAFAALGWNGWNNQGTEASVVLGSTHPAVDQAAFLSGTEVDSRLPSHGGVVIRSQNFYLAASLDLIAHEWGHGVNESRIFGRFAAMALEEGFADVIANIVEKERQPVGTIFGRSSDWLMHEDGGIGGYARGAVDDGRNGHYWYGANNVSQLYNQRVHAVDADTDGSAHATGNMIVVAMRLMAEGGRNPICLRALSTGETFPEICSLPNVTGRGTYFAQRVMWSALTNYIPAGASFTEVGQNVMRAAHNMYRQCGSGNIGEPQQRTVYDAFVAIGFPPTPTFQPYTCP